MRVVVPYTSIHPLAKAALVRHAPDAVAYDMASAHDAYYRLLTGLWGGGKSFLVVEHDVEIHADVIPQLEACGEGWCLFPYSAPNGGLFSQSLGCTRFGSQLLRAEPEFMVELPVRDWRRLDCEMYPRLTARGHAPHVHFPPCRHHHVRDGVCDCGEEHP